MINKRLLIKNLLAHNSENSFYDKKRRLNLEGKEGKAKFLKHICALANSNPNNNSFIVIGVEDTDNTIRGVDFFDDSKIQNLINAYLENPPGISYENIPFPHLPDELVVGLVRIRPNHGRLCRIRKNIWKYPAGTTFYREGSISIPVPPPSAAMKSNEETVAAIEAHSQNNIGLTLDGVFDFFKNHEDLNPSYNVFKEYFVVCWSGRKNLVKGQLYYSRVDIALINEQVKLFYSELDEVRIHISSDQFRILEFVRLGIKDHNQYYPLEEVTIRFQENATYDITTKLIFEPPRFDKKILHHIYNHNNALILKLKNQEPLDQTEQNDLDNIPVTYLLCYFNGFHDAVERLENAREELRAHSRELDQRYKETFRILRKVKYN